MVARFSTNPYVNPDGWQGENWENLGYDVYSFVAKQYYDNQGTWEWNYQKIWNEFWNISNQLHPIAIISFGQGGKDNTWRIESKAVNWNKWYPDKDGNQPNPNPPDDTVCPDYIRLSSLPLQEIEKEVNNQTTINAEINLLGTPGLYFCGYIAYLDLWYKELYSNLHDEFLCKCAGFIHVNGSIDLQESIEATNITIRKTLEKVTKNVNDVNPFKLSQNLITENRNLIFKRSDQNIEKYNIDFLQILKEKIFRN